MKKHLNTLKSVAGPIAVLTCGALLIGCAGNSPKSAASAQLDKQPEISLVTEQSSSSVKLVSVEPVTTTQAQEDDAADTATVIYPDIEIATNQQPEQRLFQFGFDQAALGEEDKDIIKQHAKYLVQNPEVVIKVIGHTDHYGPKAYNEYLSKKRAEAVTAILLAEGVMESQIQIKAMANDEPLETAQRARDNRRVELEFETINMVSK